MIRLLPRAFIALLISALLSAPCATILDAFGAGVAHAHETAHSGGADHRHGAAQAHDTAGRKTLSPAKPVKGDHAACCCECNGWIVQKAADRPALASQPCAPEAGKQLVAGYPFADVQATGPPARQSRSHRPYDALHLASAPLYAASGRLRL